MQKVLKKAGFNPVATDVFLIELDNTPGTTGRIASQLAAAGINIDYIYASAHPSGGQAYLVLRTHQVAEAEKALKGGK